MQEFAALLSALIRALVMVDRSPATLFTFNARFLASILPILLAPIAAWGSPARAVAAAWSDCQKLPPSLQEEVRYLWVSRGTAAERLSAFQVLSGWIHGQSRVPQIQPPAIVMADGSSRHPFTLKPEEWAGATFLRVQLSHYRFSRTVWDQLGFQDPYFHLVRKVQTAKDKTTGEPIYLDPASGKWRSGTLAEVPTAAPWLTERAEDSAAMLALMLATKSQSPILRADNFLWQTAVSKDRKVGYYGLLEIKDQRSYERAIGFDPKADVDPGFLDEVLAAVGKSDSGVTERSRRVERRQGFSPYWLTKDNESTDKEENNPLRTLNGKLKFNAIETYGQNPCGFWVTGLFVGNQPLDAKQKAGDRQDTAPDFIGYNHGATSNDGRIHVGLACYACHTNGGLQDVKCWFRKIQQFRPLQTTDPRRVEQLAHYLPPLDPYLNADRARYAASLKAATGLAPAEFATKLTRYFADYDAGVTLERAAEDMGVTAEQLKSRLEEFTNKTGQGDTVLSIWLLPKEQQSAIGIEDWHQSLNLAQLAIRGLVVWPEKK